MREDLLSDPLDLQHFAMRLGELGAGKERSQPHGVACAERAGSIGHRVWRTGAVEKRWRTKRKLRGGGSFRSVQIA